MRCQECGAGEAKWEVCVAESGLGKLESLDANAPHLAHFMMDTSGRR